MPRSQQPVDGERTIWEEIRALGAASVLDIGAGDGKWGRLLKTHCPKATADAVEIHRPHAKDLEHARIYRQVFNTDARNLRMFSGGQRYDVAILGDVLEHMPERDAHMFVTALKLNVGRIYLTIPVTECLQDGNLLGNVYETHMYQWSDKEIRALGFRLLNVGANENGLVAIGTYRWPA